MAAETLPLADLIEQVSAQLREARKRHRAKEEDTLLDFASCTLEMGVTWKKNAEGGLDINVVKLGGGLDKTNTQTITVVLQAPTVQWPSTSMPTAVGDDVLAAALADYGLGVGVLPLSKAVRPLMWQHVHDESGAISLGKPLLEEEGSGENGTDSNE